MQVLRGIVIGILVTLAGFILAAYIYGDTGAEYMGADIKPGHNEAAVANMVRDSSIARFAPNVSNPVPPTSANMQQAEALYHQHCEMCHGDRQHDGPLQHAVYPMVPPILKHPPDDPDGQIYWVIDHGIRWTGMPAWGKVLPPDDIWRLVDLLKNQRDLNQSAAR